MTTLKEVIDECDKGVRHHYDVIETILDTKTSKQRIEIHNFVRFGIGVWIDGWPQCAQFDSDKYHESLVHPGLIHLADQTTPFTVCVLGGGDFGIIHQLVKYRSCEKIHMVDWDLEFLEITKKHLRCIHHDAWKDPRVSIEKKTPDVFEFFRVCSEKYDVVFGDLTDLISFGSGVKSFVGQMKVLLKSDGIFISQASEFPSIPSEHDSFVDSILQTKELFKHVWIYKSYIPSFGYEQSYIIGSDKEEFDPLTLETNVIDKKINQLSGKMTEYSGSIHSSLFALPSYILARI